MNHNIPWMVKTFPDDHCPQFGVQCEHFYTIIATVRPVEVSPCPVQRYARGRIQAWSNKNLTQDMERLKMSDIELKLKRAFIWRLSTKSALSALHGVADRPFQPLNLSQLPREHNRGAVITNDVSL